MAILQIQSYRYVTCERGELEGDLSTAWELSDNTNTLPVAPDCARSGSSHISKHSKQRKMHIKSNKNVLTQ